jgi:hypothetical protein
MRKLEAPNFDAGETFLACISRVRNRDLKSRLTSVEENIKEAAKTYKTAAEKFQLHTIIASDNIAGIVTNEEMVDVYDGRMAKDGSPGRYIYDKIKSIPAFSRCPFCNQRTVTTLDHHLPKKKYSEFTVTPINLVACCQDCNKIKSSKVPSTANDVLLHPYFDNVENDRWLFARVVQGCPASLEFYVDPPVHWDSVLKNRIFNHFSLLDLDSLYRSHSGEEIANIRFRLTNLFNAGGELAVKDSLEESFSTYFNSQSNSWQTSMYDALRSNDWFCSIGYSLI